MDWDLASRMDGHAPWEKPRAWPQRAKGAANGRQWAVCTPSLLQNLKDASGAPWKWTGAALMGSFDFEWLHPPNNCE